MEKSQEYCKQCGKEICLVWSGATFIIQDDSYITPKVCTVCNPDSNLSVHYYKRCDPETLAEEAAQREKGRQKEISRLKQEISRLEELPYGESFINAGSVVVYLPDDDV
jgi:hypothetical protein